MLCLLLRFFLSLWSTSDELDSQTSMHINVAINIHEGARESVLPRWGVKTETLPTDKSASYTHFAIITSSILLMSLEIDLSMTLPWYWVTGPRSNKVFVFLSSHYSITLLSCVKDLFYIFLWFFECYLSWVGCFRSTSCAVASMKEKKTWSKGASLPDAAVISSVLLEESGKDDWLDSSGRARCVVCLFVVSVLVILNGSSFRLFWPPSFVPLFHRLAWRKFLSRWFRPIPILSVRRSCSFAYYDADTFQTSRVNSLSPAARLGMTV